MRMPGMRKHARQSKIACLRMPENVKYKENIRKKEKRNRNATIRTKLFYKFGVMGSVDDRSIVYNSVEIFITDMC